MTDPDSINDPADPFPVETRHQRFSVPFHYPVHFTREIFNPANPLLANTLDRLDEGRRHRAAFYIDSGVIDKHPGIVKRIKQYFHAHPEGLELVATPEIIQGGEGAKAGWDTVQDVMWTIGNQHIDRQSYIVAVGGGSVLDMVGFATSIVHRGIRLVRIPTTTLAQDDAGVGVKNGMNEHGMKNFVGSFAPPFAVINDYSFLPTLEQKDWIAGVSEAFKVAIIKDADFFEFLCENAQALAQRDQTAMEQTVRRCALLHLDHIRLNGDPFEFGSARPLDFGHWSAHKIESMTDYAVGHGQAVAIGIAVDACYAARRGMLSEAELERILTALEACGLPLWHECLGERTHEDVLVVLDGLRQFREHLGGVLTITLPDGIGRKKEVHDMNADMIEDSIEYLRTRA